MSSAKIQQTISEINNESITVVRLGGNHLTVDDTVQLVTALSNNTLVTTLYLYYCSLSYQFLALLTQYITNDTTITGLIGSVTILELMELD